MIWFEHSYGTPGRAARGTVMMQTLRREGDGDAAYLVELEHPTGDHELLTALSGQLCRDDSRVRIRERIVSTEEVLENRFTYHAPSPHQIPLYQRIRDSGHAFALMVQQLCPASPETERAIDAADQAVMWANAALARHDQPTITAD